MRVRDQIEAARKVDRQGRVTDAARREIARIKARALQDRIADEREFDLPGGERAVISDVVIPHDGPGDPLSFHLRVVSADGKVFEDDCHVFNPPIMTRAGVAEDGVTPIYEENITGALRSIVEGIVAGSKGGRQ